MDYTEFIAWLQENYPDDYDSLVELDDDGDLSNGFNPEDQDFMSVWEDLLAEFSNDHESHLYLSEESDIKPKD